MYRIAIFLVCTMAAFSPSVGLVSDRQPTKPDGLLIPIPDGRTIDTTVWKRLTEGYQDQKRAFLDLLLEMDANTIDYAADSLGDIDRKRQAVAQLLGRYQGQMMSGLNDPELESDYIRVGWEVWPRVTGRAVQVGAEAEFATLEQALPKLQPGDVVKLGAGSFVLEIHRDRKPVTDVAFLGLGAERTSLSFKYVNGFGPLNERSRWRLADLTIDCQGGETDGSPRWIPGGAVELQNCTIVNYSTQGAIARMAGAMLIEDCLFEGGDEQMGGRPFGPMWSQGEPTYIRTTRFIDNHDLTIHSNAALVLDRCRFEKRNMQRELNLFLGPHAFLRANRGINPVGQQPRLLAYDSDDAEFIAAVRGEDRQLDERSRRLIDTLKLDRHAIYWIGLLRHRAEKFRRLAAERVQSLLGQEVRIPEEPKADVPDSATASAAEIAQAIRQLDSDDFRSREQAAAKLRGFGDDAVAALREAEQSGSIEQRASAHALLSEIAGPRPLPPAPLAWDIEYGRLARWYDAQRGQLIWNETQRRYVPR